MNSIPLIKGNTPQEINTSIISLKKALAALEGNDKDVQNKIKQINELINGINSHLENIDGQITDLQPIDVVTSGDMHSVTSNAVAQAISNKANRFPISSLVYVSEKTYEAVTEDTIDIEAGNYNYVVLPYVPSASIPQGFHIEYVCSWLGGTSGTNKLQVWVNNLLIGEVSSYTPDSKFLYARSRAFTREEIVLEPVLSYSNNGINIKVKLIPGSSNGRAFLRSLTITAFLIADSNVSNRSIEPPIEESGEEER